MCHTHISSNLSTIILVGLIYTVKTQLTAVSNGLFIEQLYQRIRNEDPPSELDPASIDARTRKRICEDLGDSGFFDIYQMRPVRIHWAMFTELRRPPNSDIFHQMYARTRNRAKRLLAPYTYTNPYTMRPFQILSGTLDVNEYVFMCPFKKWYTGQIIVYYVSKEYNVSGGNEGEPYKAGRFIFRTRGLGMPETMALAEEPAKTHLRQDFNVELYYLRMRRQHQAVEDENLDPICKLVPDEIATNQHSRLCTAVLTSSHFKNKLQFVTGALYFTCNEEEVGFRTAEAVATAAEESYYEWMINCVALSANKKEIRYIYISRAYVSGQVFVYQLNVRDDKLYLENLSTNLSIVREPTSQRFDDVE